MEQKKSKKILAVIGPIENQIPLFYELIKELVSLGHNVTCYVLQEFESKIKPTGASLKAYTLDKINESRIPPAIAKRAVVPLAIANSYIHILDDALKSQEQYDFLIVDSSYDGNEMNKIFKIPTVIALYKNGLGEKSPFIEMSMAHRSHYWMPANKKFNLNIKDFLLQQYNPDAKYKLMLTSKMFQTENRKLDDSFFFIGPSFYERPIDNTFKFKKDEGKKLIYVSFGITVNTHVDLYKMCIEAFGNSKEFQVVMSIGKKNTKQELGDIPENFSVYNYLPQLQVLAMTDVFINNGGNNSINEALSQFHLPMIVVPAMFSHEENAKVIEKYEAGIVLDKDDVNPEVLKETVKTYLANKEKYLKGVDKIVQSFKEARNERKKVFEKIFA